MSNTPWYPGSSTPILFYRAGNDEGTARIVNNLQAAMRIIPPLVSEMHTLQKEVDIMLAEVEDERIIRENQALEQQLSTYKSKWDIDDYNDLETASEFKPAKK
jgi:hypothetical protein